ncbi:Ldh family oxidoreductase [Alicyclobacillus sp. SO9]|uniref:Ldh family oxidoreductase n=1 Tax=Alicyclobacillus sp. SO9 TaxID=2665646 RepID=UPI0018E8A73C|nr:Ldh family oxidoreductase [Alicyclobacillus sp. SO9]QQE80487.1 Ldh family oxidoreductase [Alicyclobacillus sp. SO9]
MTKLKFMLEELKRFGEQCLVSTGVPKQDAVWTTEVLMKAELQGRSSHGISRLSAYVEGIQRGKINPVPDIQVSRITDASVNVNGDDGLGPVIAKIGIDSAVESASKVGVGAVSVSHGNHAGALGIYASRAADQGLIGLAVTNAQPAIPPWGGRQAFFGTNPIAMSAGTGDNQIIIDLATSIVARGNIILAAKSGMSIPEGWALDREGNPTTNAQEALLGSVLPVGGAKGYSLALMVEVLSGVLSGAAIGNEVGSIYNSEPGAPNTGMFFLAINPEMYIGEKAFAERLKYMEDLIHSIPTAPDTDVVYLPGERRRYLEKVNRESGVSLSSQTGDELITLAENLHVEPPQRLRTE